LTTRKKLKPKTGCAQKTVNEFVELVLREEEGLWWEGFVKRSVLSRT